ncbi:hypothetical protein ABIB25_003070 [Nakamurella sp. UYEF19]|uniref:hypothetical protein n=1 Tax=Nakamurella sp. UYEF19 TaxID=1756392 RepID=UPI0033914687
MSEPWNLFRYQTVLPVGGADTGAEDVIGPTATMPDVAAVAANVTAVAPVSPGYLIVAPNLGVRPPPFTSSSNLSQMRSVADGTLTGVGTGGAIAVYKHSDKPMNVIIDVTLFFRLFAVAAFHT